MQAASIRCLAVVTLFLLVPFNSVVAEHPNETVPFTSKHDGIDFPVGWITGHQGEGEAHTRMQVLYPAMEDGLEANMAGNGPFTWVQFIGDDGEDMEQYMLLATSLAKRGHIVIVHAGVSDATDLDELLSQIEVGYELMVSLNSSNEALMGSFGQIDLDHWGLGGHGHGAAAAYGVMPFWNERSGTPDAQPPRAVFGLGTDFSSWGEGNHWTTLAPEGWVIDVPKPSTGLFVTGTLDGVAEFNDVTTVLNATDEFGWHAMQLLGANHYQFQESTSFFESLSDGDAAITQEQQIERTAAHVVPYLDLTLRGDHESFRTAFNRPDNASTLSDANAYLQENLVPSHFLKEISQTTAPSDTSNFSTQDTVNWRVNWTLRDGTPPNNVSSSWLIQVECQVLGMPSFDGTLTEDKEAECLYPMADVPPGEQVFQLQIRVEGAPMTLYQPFNRTDAPLVFTTPIPSIDVEQRGSLAVEAASFATDPDGQNVLFVGAYLVGRAIGNFSISIDSTGESLTVTHTAPGEYVDGADVLLKVRATGDGVIDEGEVTTIIRVVPVDDPVVVDSTVPMQNMVEDGPPTSITLKDFVTDPEDEVLIASVSGQTQGLNGPVEFTISQGILTMTPRENMHGASILHLLVSDGVNTPVELDVPLYIEPLNDPLTVNNSYWSIELLEDDAIALNLSEMAWDIDGDVLFWTISDQSANVDVVRAASQILISGAMDYSGFDNSVYLNVSDGELTHSALLNITVLPQPDAPLVTIKELNSVDDRSGGLMWWVYDPDGAIPSEANISVNGTMLENLSHSCSFDSSSSTNRCLTFIEYPSDESGTVEIRVAVIDGDLGIESVSYMNVNLSGDSTPAPTTSQGESDGSTYVLTGVALMFGFVVVLVLLVVLVSRRKDTTTMAQLVEMEEEVPIKAASSGGLLARAQNQK